MAACGFCALPLLASPEGFPGRIEIGGRVLADIPSEAALVLQRCTEDTVSQR
jgi:hypothetical protein